MSMSKSQRLTANSFQSTFMRIGSVQKFTAHVEAALTKNENASSYANASFIINPRPKTSTFMFMLR